MNAQAKQERLLEIYEEATTIQAKADAEKRDLSASEDKQLKALFAEFSELENRLETIDGFEALEAWASKPRGRMAGPQPIYGSSRITDAAGEQYSARRTAEAMRTQRKPYEGRHCVDLFNRANVHSVGGFKSSAEFLQTIANGLHHPALIRNSSMSEGTGSDGGFMVPGQLLTQIFDEALEQEIIRPRATVFGMESNELTIAGLDYSDHTGGAVGGLTMEWLAEGATGTAQKGKFRAITLRARKGATYCDATNELIFDGMQFERQLVTAMSAAVAQGFDTAFIRGDGVGKPLGILNCPSTIAVPKASGQAPDTILFENVASMWARLAPAFWRDAIWLCNSDALPQLLQMTFPTGSATGQPLFLPNANIGEMVAGSIFGRPLYFSEKCSTIGDVGDLILCAPSQYAIGLRLDARFDRSNSVGFMQDISSYRLVTRAEGQPLMNSAITPLNGSNTVSWAVVLDARA